MTILPPDYYTMVQQAYPDNPIWGFLVFALQFHIFMILYIIVNMLLTAGICWGLLIIFRILGIPWLDGTTKGFINRS